MAFAAPRPPLTPLWEFVEESFDEAEFAFRGFERALTVSDRDLFGFESWLEERLLGCFDGLCAGGRAAIEELLLPALDSEEPARKSVAAHVLAELSERALLERLRDAGESFSALARGIELARGERFSAELACSRDDPELQRLELRICGFRGRLAPTWTDALGQSPALQVAALSSARHAPPEAALGAVVPLLDSEDAEVRDAAVTTGLVLGAAPAWARCQALARAGSSARAILLCALVGRERDHEAVRAALSKPELARDAAFALGFAGTRDAVDACVAALSDPALERTAADSFATITGIDLGAEQLTRPEPTELDEPVPFEDDDLDGALRPAADAELPLPDVPAILRCWAGLRDRFAPGVRYLYGRPVDRARLVSILRGGPMRRRHGVALELAVRSGGRFQLETRAFVREQRPALERLAALERDAPGSSPLSGYFSLV